MARKKQKHPRHIPQEPILKQHSNEIVWNIMNLWYKDSYEEACKSNQQLKKEIDFWTKKYHELGRSYQRTTLQNTLLQQRIREDGIRIQGYRNIIEDIMRQFPEVGTHYTVGPDAFEEVEESDEEDLLDLLPVRRRLF